MDKGFTMISGHKGLSRLARFAQVQFLALIAMLTVLTLPALAAAEDDTAPDDFPDAKPAQPAIEPAQPIDESRGAEVVQAQVHKFIKSLIDVAQSFGKTEVAEAELGPFDDAEIPAAQAAKEDEIDVTEVTTKEAEIDAISVQIEFEKVRAARRIAELEQQLNEARDQLTSITATDGEGFIRSWLILGPIRLDEKVSNHTEESNKEFLDRQYVSSKAAKDGDKVTIDGAELNWKAVQTSEYSVDLAQVANEQELDPENAAYLGVAYITSREEITDAKLSIGSDDGSVWRLNGTEVIRSYNGRGVAKDQDTAEELTLKKGVNVLTFTVLNGRGPTAAAARFVDENGTPIRGLKVSLTPPAQQIADTNPENLEE